MSTHLITTLCILPTCNPCDEKLATSHLLLLSVGIPVCPWCRSMLTTKFTQLLHSQLTFKAIQIKAVRAASLVLGPSSITTAAIKNL